MRLPVFALLSLALAASLSAAPAAAQGMEAVASDEVFAESARSERGRLQQERDVLEAQFKAQEQVCQQRFWVNACTRDVALRKRQALAALRRREQVLELAERQRRLDAALARAEARQLEQSSRAPAEPEEDVAARRQRELQSREQERARREAEAASRAEQQQAREAEAERRRQAREEEARQRPARPALPDPTGNP